MGGEEEEKTPGERNNMNQDRETWISSVHLWESRRPVYVVSIEKN